MLNNETVYFGGKKEKSPSLNTHERQLHTSHNTNNVRKCVTLVGTFRGYMNAALRNSAGCMWYEKRWLKQLRNNNIFKQFVL